MAFGQISGGEAAWQAYQDYYFNCIRDVDRHLVTVLDALQASGQAERTIVVYTSDHGEMAGAHGLRQKGPFMYQENTRVPFIVRHPDVSGARRTQALGSAVDLIPTLLEMAGCDARDVAGAYPQLAGVSVAGAVARPDARTERDARGILFNYNTTHYIDVAYATELLDKGLVADRHMPLRALAAGMRAMPQRHHPTLFRGIHTGRYKFARYFKPSEHHQPKDWETLTRHNQLELYDLQADPGELDNLAHAPEWTRSPVLELNTRLRALVQQEVGPDLGDELVGPAFMKRL
jgi:arylsulfatase A-like enzyme